MQILLPDGWPQPRGYANGVVAEGRLLFVAGQVGWDAQGVFKATTLAAQARQALENTVAVLRAGGAEPHHVVRMTWFVLDKRDYADSRKEIGAAWRDIIGGHYPAMTLVEVSGLLEDAAKVEIETTAVVPRASEE